MKTLVTGSFGLDDTRRSALTQLGLELTFHADERQPVENAEAYELVICNGLFAFQDISHFNSLRFIQLTSAGMDRLPMAEVNSRGIQVRNAAGVYSVPMAEWTLMRLMELYRNVPALLDRQRAGLWEKDRSWQELTGKTACILGFGAYGAEIAKRLKAFGMDVLAVNRTRKDSPWVDSWFSLEELDAALEQADVLILAVALTDDTKKILDSRRLGLLKKGAVVLNAARGGLLDEQALIDRLNDGHLFGAALDVFSTEPLPAESPLWHHPQVLVSPHNSFVSDRNYDRLTRIVVKNIRDMITET